MNTPDIVSATRPIVEAFESLGVDYCIAGSVASSAHGIARATLDVDLVADLVPAKVGALVSALLDTYYIDKDAALDAITRRSMFKHKHSSSPSTPSRLPGSIRHVITSDCDFEGSKAHALAVTCGERLLNRARKGVVLESLT